MIIGEGSHPENVKVYGPGVEKMGLKTNEPTYFTVDCSEAGQGETWSRIHFLTNRCWMFSCRSALNGINMKVMLIFQYISAPEVHPRCAEDTFRDL